ncbi:hypothetical protein H489_0109850 [Curtobacterium flaccumfaciens UCD-AKU]|uniref:hypothetical protein n=1 Tax=Curtobacterium flaccumfaciens TaxID=2035 RepID=UPI0003694D2B|nr:hypothetical protein [Curtobacterium flaccumfaciens]EYT63965.1 hypothetical protein H489_0109850 [Curtobacterium flaccumfaciens UCD-AKU]
MTIEKDAGESVDVDLAVDWRAQDPLTLSVEPVPSVEEAVGKKVSAAYGRAGSRRDLPPTPARDNDRER